jgi:hypothetical protein
MPKFEEHVIQSTAAVHSPTSWEEGASMSPYVWDTTHRPKEDPFFAVPHIVFDRNRIAIQENNEGTVFITF